ncbi:hypothetical protein D3C81_969050 [compost metagenome]
MAGRQAGIPQQRKQPRQCRFVGLLDLTFAEHQQVDVRTREQLTAPITAHGEQRQASIHGNAAPPGFPDQLIGCTRTHTEQALDVVALLEAFAQAHIGMRQRLPRLRGPLCITGRTCRRVRYVIDQARRQLTHACADSAGDSVSTSTPSSVTAIMCSHCAESLRSLVTTVQPSGSTLV